MGLLGAAVYFAVLQLEIHRYNITLSDKGGLSSFGAGSFLGEYQAGGLIIVLGLEIGMRPIVGNFPCTGMHGGKMILRSDCCGVDFPGQVTARPASREDMTEAEPFIRKYCELFGTDAHEVLDGAFTAVTPDSKNPYKQMYVSN